MNADELDKECDDAIIELTAAQRELTHIRVALAGLKAKPPHEPGSLAGEVEALKTRCEQLAGLLRKWRSVQEGIEPDVFRDVVAETEELLAREGKG